MAVYYIFSTQSKAIALVAPVDTGLGYPKAGRDIGGGRHVPPAQSVTTTYARPLQHPTLSEWAYPADANVVPIVGPNAVTLGLPVAVALDGTWLGATEV